MNICQRLMLGVPLLGLSLWTACVDEPSIADQSLSEEQQALLSHCEQFCLAEFNKCTLEFSVCHEELTACYLECDISEPPEVPPKEIIPPLDPFALCKLVNACP